ncbi:hypothetical protein GMES_0053 [Paraglaciecola mesophila KMM 241]|uniref:Uncharacterized protein n=1 Tax=Paraglaciecola mesophila KMM 241 TaxID=1128912 RepID=K6Z048_9ALTE|nr:hypothetical protein GMES_0053 [Paraglaciecola mesophila KMM 241]
MLAILFLTLSIRPPFAAGIIFAAEWLAQTCTLQAPDKAALLVIG